MKWHFEGALQPVALEKVYREKLSEPETSLIFRGKQ
jgi:hypothetical protein